MNVDFQNKHLNTIVISFKIVNHFEKLNHGDRDGFISMVVRAIGNFTIHGSKHFEINIRLIRLINLSKNEKMLHIKKIFRCFLIKMTEK